MSATAMGVWTPWADVLCIACHDKAGERHPGRVKVIKDEDLRAIYTDEPHLFHPGFCTTCDAPILIERDDVALLTRLRRLLLPDVPEIRMEQTGGMCAALIFDRPDNKRVWITYGMCDADALELGLYEITNAEEGEMADEAMSHTTLVGDDAKLAEAVRVLCDLAVTCLNCKTEWHGDCPRCFANTRVGCPHGAVCDDCVAASEEREAERRSGC